MTNSWVPCLATCQGGVIAFCFHLVAPRWGWPKQIILICIFDFGCPSWHIFSHYISLPAPQGWKAHQGSVSWIRWHWKANTAAKPPYVIGHSPTKQFFKLSSNVMFPNGTTCCKHSWSIISCMTHGLRYDAFWWLQCCVLSEKYSSSKGPYNGKKNTPSI